MIQNAVFSTKTGFHGINAFPPQRFGQPVGAALAAALDSQLNQVMTDKHFATKHGLKYNPKRGVLGNRKGCPYIVPKFIKNNH